MKVYHHLKDFEIPKFSIVTSGTFDGVHLGHQKIFNRLQEIAQENQGEVIVITFWPHPRIVLTEGKSDLQLLSTIEEKIELLRQQKVNHLIILPFTEEFSQLSPKEFVEQVYVQGVGVKKLIIGYDHKFGKDRKGGIEYLKENIKKYGFEVEEISREDIDSVGISSTKIRNALLEGNIRLANKHLGHKYSLKGRVSRGQQIGRTIGYPTANIYVKESFKLVPGDGIFAVQVFLNNQLYNGMLYIGYRPSIKNTPPKRTIEVNIFDFSRDIYDESIEVFFIDKIREDQKFENLQKMKEQLADDEKKTKIILSKIS